MTRITEQRRPTVTESVGPGQHGYPFGITETDLDGVGYRADEYLLSGVAVKYRPLGDEPLPASGLWSVEPAGSAPYRTRILVYRPIDRNRFNGTVVLHWNNVSAGYDLFFGDSSEILDGGYAFVALTTQRVGVHGLAGTSRGLVAWDEERYAELSIPTDDLSYDIFSQAARAVGADRDRAVDPLGGLAVERVIAMGSSQSASRLATYANAIHQLDAVVDGYLLMIYFGTASRLNAGTDVLDIVNTPTPAPSPDQQRGQNRIRRDLEAPMLLVNSEVEALSYLPVRQPDTDHFRYWEVAGASHVAREAINLRAPVFERHFGQAAPPVSDASEVSLLPVYDAALRALHDWLTTGVPPRSQPTIEFRGNPPAIVRDEHGNACGGVRLPQVEVPIATNGVSTSPTDFSAFLHGSTVPFPMKTLQALYGDIQTYLDQFESAAKRACAAGVLLDRDVPELVTDGRRKFLEQLGRRPDR